MRQTIEPVTQGKASLAGAAIPAMLILLPATLFYGVLFRNLVNLPLLDDYDALLEFLNRLVQTKGVAAKFLLLLAEQHNEYKLFWVHGLAMAQVELMGHVNFAQLCVLGDGAVLVLAFLLWLMFLPQEKNSVRRLTFFVPVAWLLFQLGYCDTLNWAMASLQNLWAIVFSLAAIQCALGLTRTAYAGALILYMLAIAASGNGFLLLPVGLLIVISRRQWRRCTGWLAVTGVSIAAYAYHYNMMSSQSNPHLSVFSTLLHLRPDYVVVFVDNAGAVRGSTYLSVWICLTLGTVLLVFFGWLAWRGYALKNPAVACSVLFIILTAIGVAGIRSDFGLVQGLSSRYAIYGALLAIFAWAALAEEFLQNRNEPSFGDRVCVAMVVTMMLYGFFMDEMGYQYLAQREQNMVKAMTVYEHTAASPSPVSPVPIYPVETEGMISLRQRALGILGESIRLGVYEPPKL